MLIFANIIIIFFKAMISDSMLFFEQGNLYLNESPRLLARVLEMIAH